jgi:hypothetical protein
LSKEDFPNPNTWRDTTSPYPYSQIVGSLMHAIVNFRPNCVYVVNSLAQYLTNAGPSHIQTLKRVLWYIKGTLTLGIKYQQSPNGDILHGFCDANWVGDKDTCRSTSSYYFLLASGVIS